MHFLVEPKTLACLTFRRVYVAEQHARVVGFLVASPVPLRQGWLIEQIVRGHNAPNGTSELLINAAMHEAAAAGDSYITAGLSPLSRRGGIPLPVRPVWLRLLFGWLREHGRRFYNFDGLDAFKAKLMPDSWEPIYALTNERQFSPHTLYAIAGAFSGMSPLWFVGRGVVRAVQQEIHWLREHWSGV
jgi:phosphatidylglycerol lysyltransferase